MSETLTVAGPFSTVTETFWLAGLLPPSIAEKESVAGVAVMTGELGVVTDNSTATSYGTLVTSAWALENLTVSVYVPTASPAQLKANVKLPTPDNEPGVTVSHAAEPTLDWLISVSVPPDAEIATT